MSLLVLVGYFSHVCFLGVAKGCIFLDIPVPDYGTDRNLAMWPEIMPIFLVILLHIFHLMHWIQSEPALLAVNVVR